MAADSLPRLRRRRLSERDGDAVMRRCGIELETCTRTMPIRRTDRGVVSGLLTDEFLVQAGNSAAGVQ